MWLRDDLPKRFPRSRVIIYGYNSKLHGSLSVQSATDIAMRFHEAMTDIRSVPEKPLLLLGHSLGGIVIKEALHMIRTSEDQVDKVNFGAISGILFFGVPNQGMDIQSLIPMAGDGFNRGFLHTLESQSPVLRTQAQQWSQTDADLNCNIINFYETQASPTARLMDDGTWTMTGPPAVLVDSHSATHGRLRNLNGHRIHPIDCSHSDLVKFSSSYDEAYKTVLRYLRSIDAEIGQRRMACLESLGFPEQYDRMDSLDPDDRTCDWLIKNEVFTSWLNSPKGLLWICGNPGSGKSMAMKRALLYFNDRSDRNELVVSFFIHGQGTDLQKSSLGLYRSLLHQLYSRLPDSCSKVTESFKEHSRTMSHDWRWMSGEVRRFFLEGLPIMCRRTPIILLVDALDEAGDVEARKIVSDLKTLVASLKDDGAKLRICFSCRHYPHITLDGGDSLVVENANRHDIGTVVSSRVESTICFEESEKEMIKSEVIRRSAGMFQWACLISEIVIQARETGDPFRVALKKVQQAPADLDTLYESLLGIEDGHRMDKECFQMLKLFQWVMFQKRPLSSEEMQHALALDCEMTQQSIYEYTKGDEFIDSRHDMEIKLRNRSKGLIRFQGDTLSRRAEFIHQSVPDFLLRKGLKLLAGENARSPRQLAHFQLSRSCLKYLSMAEIRDNLLNSLHGGHLFTLKEDFPFISYAWENWTIHVSGARVEASGSSEDFDNDILKLFQWPDEKPIIASWKFLRPVLGSPFEWALTLVSDHIMVPEWPGDNGMTLAHLLAFCGLTAQLHHIRKFQRIIWPFRGWRNPLKAENSLGWSPLEFALLGQQKATVQFLIKRGAKVNRKMLIESKWGDALLWPLHIASTVEDPDIVTLLLNAGATVNPPIASALNTPLQFAVELGNRATAKRLLEAGADVNAVGLSGRLALLLAVQGRPPNCDIISDLLDYGAGVKIAENLEWIAHEAIFRNKIFLVELFIQRGALAIDTRVNGSGKTLLQVAVQGRSYDSIRSLLQLGADANAKDSYGVSPLLLATSDDSKDNIGTIEPLIQSGADVNARSTQGETPLSKAAEQHHPKMVKYLLQSGADANSTAEDGSTPLLRALSPRTIPRLPQYKDDRVRELLGTTEALIQHGANISAKNSEGKTALDYAVSEWSDYPEIADLLREVAENRSTRRSEKQER